LDDAAACLPLFTSNMENSADGWSSLMSVKVAGPVLREQVRRLFFHAPRCASKVIGNQP
jgi:hypothetical protein